MEPYCLLINKKSKVMKFRFLIATFLVVISASQTVQAQNTRYNQTRSSWIDGDNAQINTDFDGHRYELRLVAGKLKELTVDGKQIAESDFGNYDAPIKKIMEQLEKDRKQAEKDRAQAEKDREQAGRDRQQAEKDREQATKDRARAEVDRTQAEKERQQADKDRAQAEKDREQAEKDREQATKDRAQAEKDRAQAEIDRKKAEEDRKMIDAFLTEIVSSNLSSNKNDLKSIMLDDTQFTINGTKQSDAIHSQFKTKYLKGKNRISYTNSVNYQNISIQ
jgi:hypothetical protein